MLREQLNEALKTAMRAKDQAGLRTLRLILAALKDRDISARGTGNSDGVKEEEIRALLATMVKQRLDSITQYEAGGRADLAAGEREEIEIISRFLPRQLSEDEVKAVVAGVLTETGAAGIKDMGRCMAELKTRYSGQMDFTKASALVKAALV
jgi:uncharacterized protein